MGQSVARGTTKDRVSGARSSQLVFEQAAGGEGLGRGPDMIEKGNPDRSAISRTL